MKRLLLVTFVAIQALDIVSTNRVLAAGGWEANPLEAYAQASMGAWWCLPKMAVMIALAVLMVRWRPRWIAAAVALSSVAVVSNFLQ